jgi:hypothetical protein
MRSVTRRSKMANVNIPVNLVESFNYFLTKGPGDHKAKPIIDELGMTKIRKMIKLRTFFNKNEQYGYRIVAHGPDDKEKTGPDSYFEFIFP